MSQHRVVMLKDTTSDRYLPIWIGPPEADAITIELQNQEPPRPLTHDLLKDVIEKLGAEVKYVLISELRDDIFYAQVVMRSNGRTIEIDSRPSDAIALAVRVKVPIYVADKVMDIAITEDEEVSLDDKPTVATPDDEKLSIFKDFVESLDMDDLDDKA